MRPIRHIASVRFVPPAAATPVFRQTALAVALTLLALPAESAPRRKPVARPTAASLPAIAAPDTAAGSTPVAPPPAAPVAAATARPATVMQAVRVEATVFDTNPYAEENAPYKAKISGDQRRVKELAETPATIQVLTQQALQEAGKQDLREALAAQPGVTIGTGENGNAFGDRYIIRGQEARSDTFIDGLRDPGMTTREIFAVDQVEVTKGPSSSFAGRGSTGGAINLITKQANADRDFTKIDLGFGTDRYHRTTLDANKVISEQAAVRLNLMEAGRDVPDRAPADRNRRGLLLSGRFQPSDSLTLTGDYYHLDANDTPDLGTYFNKTQRMPQTGVPVYLQSGTDHLDTTIDTVTLRASWRLNDRLRLQNATRLGRTSNSYITTGANERTVSFDGTTTAPSVTLSSHQGLQDVKYLVNRSDLFWRARDAFGKTHQLIAGLEFNDEQVVNGNYQLTNQGAPTCRTVSSTGAINASNNAFCITDAAGSYVSGINTLLGRKATFLNTDSDYRIRTVSASLMDTVDLTSRLSAFYGARYDHYDYQNLVGASTTPASQVLYARKHGFWNGHLGATFKVHPKGQLYAAVGSSSDLNGGESDTGASCGYGGICTTTGGLSGGAATAFAQSAFRQGSPERTVNYELGTKWQLVDDRLLATAALFKTRKRGVYESATTLANQSDQTLNGQNSYTAFGTLSTGANEVEGIELALSGNLTDKLSTLAGVALMNGEVTRSVTPAFVGKRLNNFAERSATILLRYQAAPRLAVGGAVTHKSEMQAGQPDTADGFDVANNRYGVIVPAFTVMDAFAEYRVSDRLSTRLNVNNVTNKEYTLAAYRSGSFMYLGDKRNSYLTLSYKF